MTPTKETTMFGNIDLGVAVEVYPSLYARIYLTYKRTTKIFRSKTTI